MATVTDITTLRAQVKTNLVRSSIGDSDIDGWIQLVEARGNHGMRDGMFDTPALRSRDMRHTDPTFAAATEFVDLPDDYLAPVVIRDPSTVPGRGDGIFVDIVSAPQVVGDRFGLAGTFRYVIIHGTQMQFAPFADAGQPFSLQFTYYRKITPLTDAAPTNWLIATSPGIYLSGCLLEAHIQYRNDKEAQRHAAGFTGLVRALNISAQQSLYAPGQRAYSDVVPGGYGEFVRG